MKRHLILLALLCVIGTAASAAETQFASHPPMRPLPEPSAGAIPEKAAQFVDAKRGDDTQTGSQEQPWKTLAHALRRLKPGDTLYLRGGTYFEKVFLSRSGTQSAPIKIGSYPGELAVIDGSLREFQESPATSWEPFAGGAEGEFVSTKTFPEADARHAPRQFLPASWEPMWGIEDERPLALGQFADSMVPLHGYRFAADLRATNEFWLGNKVEMRDAGIYGGPGLWFDRDTAQIHIRLAHHQLTGLGDHAYRGETDPRKLPLVVALGFGEEVLRLTGIKHVRLEHLAFRGATGSPMIQIYGSESVTLDHVTIYGGFPGLLVNASKKIEVTHSAFRGLAAPWTSRAHMKYRGTPSYQVILQNDQPVNENIVFEGCEFTDDHDFAFFRFAKNLLFHHNFVDNFNDDGFECGPKLRDHRIFIYENRIGACLSPLTQHEGAKDESPLDHEARSGVFVFRNVFDLRAGTYKSPPEKPDPTGAFLHEEGQLASDHGSPIWPVIYFYHNTVLRETPVFRDLFLFGLAVQGLRHTERDVLNNIFVQMDRVPGVMFTAMWQAENLREGGNLLWGAKQGPAITGDPFAKFRASPLFAGSQQFFPPGWTTLDRVADPKFVNLPGDLQLQPGSPAIDGGQPLPPGWPDPFGDADQDPPDIGAIPFGIDPWGVGVDLRIPLFGERK